MALLGALLQTACPGGAELDDADRFVDGGTGTGGSAAGGSVAGGGSPTGGGAACDIPALLNLKCGASICHGTADLTTTPLGSVNLVAPGVEGRIYNVDAVYANIADADPMNCPTPAEKLLDSAGGLTKSLMYTKVNGSYVCGAAMPAAGTLNPDQITCYNNWLTQTLASPPTN